MRNIIKYIFIGVLVISSITKVNAQVNNWAKLDGVKHITRAYLGLDYGLVYGISHGNVTKIKNTTLIYFVDLSLPLGSKVFDDYRFKAGASVKAWQSNKWVLSGGISLVNRQNKSPFVKLQNLAVEPSIQFGFYKKKWVVNIEIADDYSFATHFKHTEAYKGNYPGVVDGWYKNTANNISLGLNTGYSFRRFDITLSPGIIRTDGVSGTPSLPFYGKLGINFRY